MKPLGVKRVKKINRDTPFKRTYERTKESRIRRLFPCETLLEESEEDRMENSKKFLSQEIGFPPNQMKMGLNKIPKLRAPSKTSLTPDPRVETGFQIKDNVDLPVTSEESPTLDSSSSWDSPEEVDKLPLKGQDVKNSTLLTVSSAQDIYLQSPPDVSAIADTTTPVLFEGFGTDPIALGPGKGALDKKQPKKGKNMALAANTLTLPANDTPDDTGSLCLTPKRADLQNHPVLFGFTSEAEKETFFQMTKRRAFNLKSLTLFPSSLFTGQDDV